MDSASAYLTEKIPTWFPKLAAFPPELMRCHRPGRPGPQSVGKQLGPRPMIMKFLRYTDRDRILNEARGNPPTVGGFQLKFAPDYSEATAAHRKPCYKLMHEARVQGYKAFLLYPATIKLTKGNEIYTFTDLKEAADFFSPSPPPV